MITFSSEGNLTAGENYTLTCTATVIEGLSDDAVLAISLADSRGDPVPSNVVQVSDVETMAEVMFQPLLLSHGGYYICNASITISAASIVKRNSKVHDIITQSKWQNIVCGPLLTMFYCSQFLRQMLK